MFKTILKYFLLVLVGLGLCACCWLGYMHSSRENSGVRCERMVVEVRNDEDGCFIDDEDIRALIEKECGDFIGRKLDSLDVDSIEKAVLLHNAIESGDAYVSADSTLHVLITQKKPFLRFQRLDGGFYVAEDGTIFPLQKRHSANVRLIDGTIPVNAPAGYCGKAGSEWEQKWIGDMISLVKYIDADKTWRHNIVQIHVEDDGELILIPREGKEKIFFGGPNEMERKFSQLARYYTSVAPAKDPGYYSSVNVKFEGQLICRQ